MATVVRFHQLGGPENLRFEEIPSRQPGQGEVRLRVQATGLNRAESLYYRGEYREEPGLPFEYGLLSGKSTPFPLWPALKRGVSMRGYSLTEFAFDPTAGPIAKKYIYDRLADGRFVPHIARMFPFSQAVEAYRYLESNQQVGKVVITVP